MKVIFTKKMLLVILLGVFVVISVFYFNYYTQRFLVKSNKIISTLEKIRSLELRLNYEILKNGVFLYSNNDFIAQNIKKIEEIKIDFKDLYPLEYKKFIEYKKNLQKKINYIYQFQILNSSIKNSIIFFNKEINYLSDLIFEEIKNGRFNINDYLFFQKANSFVISLFISRNALDRDFLVNNISFIKNYTSSNEKIDIFKKLFLIHMNVVLKNYPLYKRLLNQIIDESNIDLIKDIKTEIFHKEQEKIKAFRYFSYILIMFIIFISFFIAYLLARIEIDKIKLKKSVNKLKEIVNKDFLTGLLNRMKFNKDIKKIQNPVLLILNINRFKNFNDIYGTKHGDLLLKKVARYLTKVTPPEIEAKFYRLGSDDFGVLYQKDKIDSIELANYLKNKIESYVFKIRKLRVSLSVSIGIADIPPLLENADMALKAAKERRKNILKYSPSLDIRKKIQENIKKYNIIYSALKEDRIIPYFQPIVKIKDKSIVKYEVLARIKHDNKVESISSYLKVAKENKIYSELTSKIFDKTYTYVKDKNIKVSMNLSIEDILDKELMKNIFSKYANKNISHKVTFEMLESEAIEDYEIIKKFINSLKKYKIQVALDDFGSGYSNFAHILNLNIDYIKIDGSLIRNITNNYKSYQLVKLIVDFCKQNNIKTIAEYVENEKIHKKLVEIGVDYGQGYYYGKPMSEIL